MELNDLFDGVSTDTIKRSLVLKRIKGNEYYYLKSRSAYLKKDLYVCQKTCSDKELRTHFCLAMRRMFQETFNALYNKTKQKYKSECLGEEQTKQLEYLRFGYSLLLNRYDESDLQKYEEAVYTKYVFGTTSIEGNTYDLRETDMTLNQGLTVAGKEKREFFEIENYSKLKKYLDSKRQTEIDISLIRKIHEIIMDNIDFDSAGRFRKIDVGIRGTEFEPQPALFVIEEMNKLINWHNKNKGRIHPVELASLFHQRFEEIHPFKDGNGRVGRELIRIMLKQNSYPTIFIGPKNREEYLNNLDKGNNKNHAPLCHFLATNLLDVHKNLIERAEKDLNPKEDTQKRCEKCINNKKCKQLGKTVMP